MMRKSSLVSPSGSRRVIVSLSVLALAVALLKLLYEISCAASVQQLQSAWLPVIDEKRLPHLLAAGVGSNPSGHRSRSGWAHVDNDQQQTIGNVMNTSTKVMRNSWGRISETAFSSRHSVSVSFLLPGRLSAPGSAGTINWAPFLVVIVCSKPENTQLRLAIRGTWGLNLDSAEVMLRFFVGRDDFWDSIMDREQALHNDVIKTDYVDTYVNLTYKVLSAVAWTVGNVKRAQYVMKVDDDTYVNVPYLLHELRSNVLGNDLSVMGALCVNSSVVRDPSDKWFVTYLDYPSDVFPTYIFGGGYVMSLTAARAILAAHRKSDYLHLEDVFVTGILAKRAGIRRVAHAGFSYWMSKRPSPCEMALNTRVTAVNLTANELYKLYSGVHRLFRTGNWTACLRESSGLARIKYLV